MDRQALSRVPSVKSTPGTRGRLNAREVPGNPERVAPGCPNFKPRNRAKRRAFKGIAGGGLR